MGTPKRRKEDKEREQIQPFGRVVQVAALVALVILVAIDFGNPHEEINWGIYGGVIGIAWGADPAILRRIMGGK